MKYTIEKIASIMKATHGPLKEGMIDVLLTDSRTLSFPERSLFFALQTSANDGHKYVAELYSLRVRHFVVARILPEYEALEEANFLVVPNVLDALQLLATHHRRKFDFPVIGVTGSNGKTIVKEMLYQLLQADFNVVRSPRSYNSQIGVPLSVWQMHDQHTLGIFEAGLSEPNEMERLRPIIAPNIGVLTNIGEAHQENFTSFLHKCTEKLLLFLECEMIIYNEDNQLIVSALEATCLSHKGLGWSRVNRDAPLFISEVRKGEEYSEIECVILGDESTYRVPFTDDASIENVIHCLAVLLCLKPTLLRRPALLEHLEPVAMRLEVKEGVEGCQLINDAYSFDINSLHVALDFMQSRRGGDRLKQTVIFSDILQTGMLPKTLYGKVAALFRSKQIDRVIGIGKEIMNHREAFSEMACEFYPSTEQFLRRLPVKHFQDELILIKGARSFHLDQITERLEKKVHETILEVDLNAIIHNFNHVRSMLADETKIICMVKAFAYGVGAFELAKTLQEQRCDCLAVAVVDEGRELRQEGISIPIMVMNPEFSSFTPLFDHMLEPEVYSFRLLEALIQEAKRRGVTEYPIHLKVDTGMHRLGFQPSELPEVVERVKRGGGLVVRSIFSHLVGSDATAHDDFTRQQVERFRTLAATTEEALGYPVLKHILNSAGIDRFPEYQLDMVRLGLALYGVSYAPESSALRNVCTLKSTILQIQHIPSGESIGYDRRSVVTRDSRVAVIPIGYADGVNRHLGNGVGEVLVHGVRCPFIGNICMDLCMVDVTDVTHLEVQEGDTVTLFGSTLTLHEIAEKLGTIPYEVLTTISPRVKRVYFKE